MLHTLISDDLSARAFLICTAAALIIGLCIALAFSFRSHFSKSFLLSLAILPAIVSVIIMMVSGSIGAGVAVGGAFALVRFRSQPGSARQISALLLAMTEGVILGMGYVFLACVFFVIMVLFYLVLTATPFGEDSSEQRELRISLPESLDYDGIFDDVFSEYTASHSLESVRTTNMGTLYELRYLVTLKPGCSVKRFMDSLRTLNGNLTVILGRVSTESEM